MAKVFGQVAGGTAKELNADTVKQVREALNLPTNYSVTINGEPAEDTDTVEDFHMVTFSPNKVKGA